MWTHHCTNSPYLSFPYSAQSVPQGEQHLHIEPLKGKLHQFIRVDQFANHFFCQQYSIFCGSRASLSSLRKKP